MYSVRKTSLMKLDKDTISITDCSINPDFRTYGECKRSSSGAGCTAAYSVSELIDNVLSTISIPAELDVLHIPAGLAYSSKKHHAVCAEVETGKHATLAGPSDNVISDKIFDKLISLACVDKIKPKKNENTLRRHSKRTSNDNKTKRRSKK